MALLDAYGRPVRRTALTERLAEPGLTGIRQAFAGSVATGLTPVRLASILRACDEGSMDDYLVLAEEMEERDPHYFSVLGMRKRAISGVAPRIDAASESAQDKRIAQAVEDHIAEHDGFVDLIEDLLDALGKGFSVVELIWPEKRGASFWEYQEFVHRDPRFFRFDRETGRNIRLRDEDARVDGIELEPYKFVVHKAKLKSGLPARGGLARVAAFTWMCKAYTVKDWMAFIETYGLPLRLGRYDQAATAEDVETLFRAVANIGTDAGAVIPKHMDVEFIDGAKGNKGEAVFENFARWGDEQVSKAVLGQTMTSDDGSSQAQAKVHNDVRLDIAAADARSVTGTINRDIVRPFVDLNFGPQKVYPKLVIEIPEPEDTDMILRNATRLVAVGVSIKQAELRAKLGFSDPQAGDEVVGGAATPPKSEARNTALNREGDGPFDALDELEDEMLEDWEDVLTPVLDPVLDAIEGAQDYEDAMRRLAEVAPRMSTAPLIDTLVKGMFKARSMGDVSDE